eukprot:TRINITY_DN30992_c0_g1_i1.p1 TRINITY_DN30992_c0_g1~~TRINITY_DN30992_c0_g1_i1.p1  ORF type:complete len:492 (+),score=38.63 TRINITY_DN30992_c0_g1_i1:68-1477(+)
MRRTSVRIASIRPPPRGDPEGVASLSARIDSGMEIHSAGDQATPRTKGLFEILREATAISEIGGTESEENDLGLLCAAILSRKTPEQQIDQLIPTKEQTDLTNAADDIKWIEPTQNEKKTMESKIKSILFTQRSGSSTGSVSAQISKVISEIAEDGPLSTTSGYSFAINLALSLRLSRTVDHLYSHVCNNNIKIPQNDYLRLMSTHNRRGDVKRTILIFRDLCKHYSPTNEAISCILHAYNKQSASKFPVKLLGYRRPPSLQFFLTTWKAGIIPNMMTFQNLVAGCGSLDVGLKLSKVAVFVVGLPPTEDLYKALLLLCALEGRMVSAKAIIKCAEKSKMCNTEGFWIQALRSHAQSPEDAIRLFNKMKNLLPHPPSETSYVVMIRIMASCASSIGDLYVLHAENLYREAFLKCSRPPLQLHTELAEVYGRVSDFETLDTLCAIVSSARSSPPGFRAKAASIKARATRA